MNTASANLADRVDRRTMDERWIITERGRAARSRATRLDGLDRRAAIAGAPSTRRITVRQSTSAVRFLLRLSAT